MPLAPASACWSEDTQRRRARSASPSRAAARAEASLGGLCEAAVPSRRGDRLRPLLSLWGGDVWSSSGGYRPGSARPSGKCPRRKQTRTFENTRHIHEDKILCFLPAANPFPPRASHSDSGDGVWQRVFAQTLSASVKSEGAN